MKIEYHKHASGLTYQVTEQKIDGQNKITVEVANRLYVDNGTICAMPFNIPPTPEDIIREKKLAALLE